MSFKLLDINTGKYLQSLKIGPYEAPSILFTEHEVIAATFNDREKASAVRDCIEGLDQERDMEIV